eukprot:1673552-Prymnesium_polylepis.2
MELEVQRDAALIDARDAADDRDRAVASSVHAIVSYMQGVSALSASSQTDEAKRNGIEVASKQLVASMSALLQEASERQQHRHHMLPLDVWTSD